MAMVKTALYRYVAMLLLVWCAEGRADMVIEQARIRLPLPGQNVTVVYLHLKNDTLRDRLLTGVSVAGAERAEIHQHQHVDGVMRMRQLEQLPLAAGGEIEFKPHGYHIMVFGVDALFAPRSERGAGQHELSLVFADGEVIRAEAQEFRF